MMFRTQYDRNRVHAVPGSPDRVLYAPEFDESGRLQLVETGTDSLYDYIQSFADSVDIHVLLKRFVNGETDVFSKVQGAYGDFTMAPKTYAEALQAVIDAEHVFGQLPVDVRGKFGHSLGEFVRSLGTPEFFERLGIDPAAPAQPEGEVKVDAE